MPNFFYKRLSLIFFSSLLYVLFALYSFANAEEQAVEMSEQDARIESTFAAAQRAAKSGPQKITLGNQATLQLPENFYFIPKKEASVFMEAIGNYVDENFYGLVMHDNMNGFVSVDFDPSGYIKDEEAKDWDVAELMQSLKDGIEESNKDRKARGLDEIEIIDWVEKPNYDAKTHRLIWSISSREKGSNAGLEDQGVNYNTYVLGREGYLTLNLVTDLATVEQEKPLAKELLSATTFNSGKRYDEYNASTDHTAEYGIAALVGGLAAKKLGLLAGLGVLLLKFWKIILIGFVAFGGLFGKLFGRKNKATIANPENKTEDKKDEKEEKKNNIVN